MEKYKLGDFCTIGSSKRIHLSDYVENGVPFYRSKEIIELSENKTLSETLFISQEKYDEIKAKFPVPKIDDILITSVGTLGKVYQVKDDFFYFKDGNLTWLRDYDESIIDVQYLYHWLRSSTFQTQISNNNIGAVQKALTIDYLKSVDIVLPRLETQQKIAKILTALDRKIALNNRINAELEKMAKILYDYWFVQFDFPDENGKPYKSSGGKMVWNEVLKREVPLGWGSENILAVANLLGGGTPSKNNTEFWDGNIPFFTPTDCDNSVYTLSTNDYITQLGLEKSSTKLFAKNSIFLTARGSVGRLSLNAIPMTMNQSCYALQSKENISYAYLYFLAKNLVNVLEVKATGSIFNSIVSSDIENTILVIPTINCIQKFGKICEPFFEQIKNNTKQSQTLTQYRDFLLPMLMNGQVEIL